MPSLTPSLFNPSANATLTATTESSWFTRWLLGGLVGLTLLRCAVLGFPPLFDTTESRYASITQHFFL
ncbi:MAG: hypothetical protein ACKO34_02915, partial [Vampirovibrionales bacterium]